MAVEMAGDGGGDGGRWRGAERWWLPLGVAACAGRRGRACALAGAAEGAAEGAAAWWVKLLQSR